MNVSGMKNVLRKLAFPFAACGLLMAGMSVSAQDYGDIERIFKFPEGDPKYQSPIQTPGETVAFRLRLFNLAGNFEKVYLGSGDPLIADILNPLMMRVQTGNGYAYARLSGLTAVSEDQTDLEFSYTVRAGDLALPMLLYGNAGSTTIGTPYEFLNNNVWVIRNMGNSSNAVWRFMPSPVNPDPTFAKANVRLQTVDFESEDWSVQQTTTLLNCLVQTTTGQAVSNNIPFYVWSGNTNIAQIVEQQPGQPSAALAILQGESSRAFRIYGKGQGQTLIYLSPSPSMTAGVTNYITKTVTVTAPPPPTVGIALDNSLTPDALGYVTLTESDEPVNPLRVTLSEPYPQDITVRLDVAPASGNIVFDASPKTVVIPANATESPVIAFAAADGTAQTRVVPGIVITPVILNATASNHFYNTPNTAKIKILNAAPQFTLPVHGSTKNANTLQDIPFEWLIEDVAADQAAGMTNIWNFGDTPTEFTQVGASGTINHMYQDAGDYTVTVYARDKDGSISSTVSFTVRVTTALPTPFIEPVLSLPSYDETNGIGSVSFRLSRDYSSDVYVRLVVEPADQSNVVFDTLGPIPIYQSETNSAALEFRILDGTDFSRLTGLTFTPVITNAPANTFFTPRARRGVKIVNTPPAITRILDQRVGLITNNVTVPANVSKAFSIEVADVNADLMPVKVTWNFGDGTGDFVMDAVSNRSGFAAGTINHTFPASGTYTVIVRAEDKDGGLSEDVEFTVFVGTAPTVTILPPAGPIFETPNAGEKDYIVVQLSSEYTEAVTVQLTITPPNSAANGTLLLDQNQVVFPAGVIGRAKEQKVYISNVKDGTDIASSAGFTITPSVVATASAASFYSNNLVAAQVRVLNVEPVINTPVATEITGTTVAYTIPQDTDYNFYWNVTDVMKDWTNNYLTITWYWGDNATDVRYGRTGVITHKYASVGDKVIRMVAEDKDGGWDDVYFKIRVAPAKQVNVSPIGPVLGGSTYASAPGLGFGMVFSSDAASRYIEKDVYFFRYDPAAVSATLIAVPYKTSKDTTGTIVPYTVTNYTARVIGLPGTTAIGTPSSIVLPYDSFVYVWQGAEEGVPADAMIPVAEEVVTVTLPESQADADGASAAVNAVSAKVIFSREWRPSDNCGDISNDGIPDLIANYYGLPALVGTDIANASDYNGDLDFLPGAASDGGGIIGGSSNTWAAVGRPFTAFLEIRGYHPGLNRIDYGSDDDMTAQEEAAGSFIGPQTDPATKGAERPTDPTKMDTDGDGYPDGWEYFFWYNAVVNQTDGVRYNPLDIGQGEAIPWEDIYLKFDPRVPATDRVEERDLDNDGLTDYEELVGGTNPLHWDSDGDGMCDGWEVLRGLNPTDARDGLNPVYNNPDGDYMAIASATYTYVPVVLEDGSTNYFLRDAESAYYTWYNYGNSNAPIALGRPVELPAGAAADEDGTVAVDVLLLHFQVNHALGFDPRTAWTDSVNPPHAPTRFPSYVSATPNTRPFTSRDEYLLMKFMSENRLNGAGASIGGGRDKVPDWTAFSTHPRTPDSDATATKDDGMPDGWELYVACAPDSRAMVINPWNPDDGNVSIDGEFIPFLVNRREFAGTDSSAAYANAALYAAGPGRVTITRPATDAKWVNKFWPTDPWNYDTDGDGLEDGFEAATAVPVSFLENGTWWTVGDTTLQYGPGTDNGTFCVRGAGLNPCTMDTDWDGLTDTWEYDFAGTNAVSAVTGNAYVDDGMDGTHGPANLRAYSPGDAFSSFDMYVTGSGAVNRNMDFDRDGLENYQEYWVQAVRHFRYDTVGTDTNGVPTLDFDGPEIFFTPIENEWDTAIFAYWWLPMPVNQQVLLRQGPFALYVSTDPREPDTDFDGMDDFYELYHGLNPILGQYDLVQLAFEMMPGTMNAFQNGWNPVGGEDLPMDFVKYPWLAGLDEADPDADGLRNLEEQIQPDTSAPACYNTDPSPLWMTDASYTNSLTARFYAWGGMDFWIGGPFREDDHKMFSFEMNEGYDTDNDGVSDKAELLLTSTAQSDPQDHDDPLRRQALWFSGENSAAQTLMGYAFNEWAFRSFTVEFWACPQNLSAEQVLLERPIEYGPSDLSTTGNVIRVNFRVGIDATGRLYGMFQNAGVHDDETGVNIVYAPVGRMQLNTWTHIALRMDGAAGKLELWLNGGLEATVDTTLIPANGVVNILADPDYLRMALADVAEIVGYPEAYEYSIRPGVIVLGARNVNPFPTSEDGPQWADYDSFYTGYIDEVRIWDGARTNDEIHDSFQKRFYVKDLLANRRLVRETELAGGSRVVGVTPQLPAELIYHYTFDNLFGADRIESVVSAPRGYNAYAVSINRPADWQVGWWSALATRSEVYADMQLVPWIENGVNHLPLGGFLRDPNNEWVYMDRLSVRNSRYWRHYSAGELPTLAWNNDLERYDFPNSNNPYGDQYISTVESGGRQIEGDLVPLGGAFAKQTALFWDSDAPSDVWAETGEDSDADGLPDWWETLRGISLASGSGDDGWYGDADDDGVTNGEAYLRDIANGWRLGDTTAPSGYVQTADIDEDGLPDWWENIFNLKVEVDVDPAVALHSDHGAMGDPDLDGLNNRAEYLIAEHYGFANLSPKKFKTAANQLVSDYFLKQGDLYFGQMFSDHDFMEDSWEERYPVNVASRFVYDAHQDPDEDGWSNWSEARYSASQVDVRADLGMSVASSSATKYEFPIPIVETWLRYNGIQPGAQIVIQAFSDPAMNGLPDATYTLGASGTAGAGTAKTLPIGNWSERVVTGTLSPGGVQPGSIVFAFTDNWTGITMNNGFDYDGILYAGNLAGDFDEVGTIDYVTGTFTFDLSEYKGSIITAGATPGTPLTRTQYVDCEISTIAINYSFRLVESWPKRLFLGRADTGYLREGPNYFFAFMDSNSDGAWNAGEPCGVPQPFATQIGWHRSTMSIELTDLMQGYVRMALPSGLRSEDIFSGTGVDPDSGGDDQTGGLMQRVRIFRRSVDGVNQIKKNVFDKVINVPRNWLHEGDLLTQGQLALDWGLADIPIGTARNRISYEVYLGDAPEIALTNGAISVFTNVYDSTRAQALSVSPINGGYVYSARPTFKWRLPAGAEAGYPAFAIEIRRGSESGTLIWHSGAQAVPSRNAEGEYVWEAPIYANTRLPNGQVFLSNAIYYWRVIAMNAKFSTTPTTTSSTEWSSWKKFRLDVNAPLESSGYGSVEARVKYYGPATAMLADRVKVQVYRNAAFVGTPAAEYTLAGTDLTALTALTAPAVNARLYGLQESGTAGRYYLCAFIDHNQNGVRDAWESWGYANFYGVNPETPYAPRPAEVAFAASPAVLDIVIEDADTDQDWFPDAWEYERNPAGDFLHLTGPADGAAGDTEINPQLLAQLTIAPTAFFTTLALGSTDADQDGLDDLNELLLGSDAQATSTAGDGYTDGDKVTLGLDPADTLRLDVTEISLASGLPAVQWVVEVQKSDASTLSLAPVATYELLYTPSLANPQWQVVRSGTVALDGVQTLTSQIESALSVDPVQGFFRVRLTK